MRTDVKCMVEMQGIEKFHKIYSFLAYLILASLDKCALSATVKTHEYGCIPVAHRIEKYDVQCPDVSSRNFREYLSAF